MFKIYVPPEGKLSCPAVLDDAELRTLQIIRTTFEYWRFVRKPLFLCGCVQFNGDYLLI